MIQYLWIYEEKKFLFLLRFYCTKILYFIYFFLKNNFRSADSIEAEILIQKIQQEDRDAFALFYRIYWKKVFHFISLYINNVSEKEDLLQEIFIKVWENRATLNPEKDPLNYLFIVSKNLTLNHLRTKNNSKIYTEIILDAIDDYTNTVEDDIQLTELTQELTKIINSLPDRQKEVFTLSRIKHYTQSQIANEMDISIKTVENHMTKALAFIRQQLQI